MDEEPTSLIYPICLITHRSLTEVVFLFTDSTRTNQATGELKFAPDYSNGEISSSLIARTQPTHPLRDTKNGDKPND